MTVWVVALSLSLYHRNNNYTATNSNYDSHPEGDEVRTEDEVDDNLRPTQSIHRMWVRKDSSLSSSVDNNAGVELIHGPL